MCLIAYRDKAGSHIPNDVIEHNLRSNPDGFGLAWRDPKVGLMYEKYGPKDYEAFRTILKKIDATDMIYAAHWRTGTAGPNNLDMAHPFEYVDAEGNFVLTFHNGVIDIGHDPHESDTAAFVDRILARLKPQWWKDVAQRFLVESSIGWSRLLLMDDTHTVILNQSQWKRENGILYSTFPKAGGYATTYQYTGTGYVQTGMYEAGVAAGVTKSAKESAETLLLPATSESLENTDDSLLPWDGISWYHMGHQVAPTSPCDSIEDEYGSTLCLTCGTEGDFYVLNGTRFIDMEHSYQN